MHTGRADLPDWWEPGWRNRLIWGDNGLVLSSLLEEFAGKVDLIYIDPPFATGADFSYTVPIGDGTSDVTKLPGIMEEVAYRDTWSGGIATFINRIYERLLLLSGLLSPNGSIYIHMGPELSDPIGVICDEVFANASKASAITWKRAYPYPGNQAWTNVTDVIMYRALGEFTFHHSYEAYDGDYEAKTYPNVEEATGRRYALSPMGARRQGGYEYPLFGITRPWRFKESKAKEMLEAGIIVQRSPGALPQYKRYLDQMKGRLVGDLWESIPYGSIKTAERTDYPTQKPEAMLERIIKASSKPGDLVLDCFIGSGTTAAVAEKLSRRWIAVDIGRFAIQTTRKRLLDIPGCKPFEMQNLGHYERKYWQSHNAASSNSVRDYVAFILDLHQARPVQGQYQFLHGIKGNRGVHVGATDAPITRGEIESTVQECAEAGFTQLEVLGWEFEMGLNSGVPETRQHQLTDVGVRLLRIPREILDERNVEAGGINFFELSVATARINEIDDSTVTVELTDFMPVIDDYMRERLSDNIPSNDFDWIDYWSVDFEYDGKVFVNQWQAYRTRKQRSLALVSDPHEYADDAQKSILVKVIDIFGNDTTLQLEHTPS